MRARSIGLLLIVSVIAAAGSLQVGLAQSAPGVGAPITVDDGCMEDVAKFDLN